MATFSGDAVRVERPQQNVYEAITSFDGLKERLEAMPENLRAQLGEVSFTDNTLELNTPQVGKIAFRVKKATPFSSISFESAQSPVPMALSINLKPLDNDTATELSSVIDVEIPMMLRPLIAPKLKEAAGMFAKFMGDLSK